MSRTGLELENIETYVVKVNINCQGCKQRVKKLLRKIEGVFSVHIDEEHRLVKVRGKVNPTTLINKLIKSGKPAEFWYPNSHPKFIKGDHNNNQLQYLRNGIEFDGSHIENGSKFGYEDGDLGNFFHNNFVENSQTDEADRDSTEGLTYLHSMHMGGEDEDSFANNGYMMPMIDPTLFDGNYGAGLRGHEFGMFHEVPSGSPSYEYNPLNVPSIIRNNFQHGINHDNGQSAYINSCMEDRHNNGNMMVKYDNQYMYHYDMMGSLIPNYGISYVSHY